jgi:hypothetical protein
MANAQACLRRLTNDPPGHSKANEAAQKIIRDGKDAADAVPRVRSLFKTERQGQKRSSI